MDEHTVSEELAKEWQAKLEEIQRDKLDNTDLVGPFLGYKPDNFDKASLKILYIGKATAGDLKQKEIASVYHGKRSPFWYFIRDLEKDMERKSGRSTAFAWSNVCKIGVTKDNPDRIIDAQKVLAVKTLRHEIQALRPSLVLFAMEGFADHIVYEVLDTRQGASNDLTTHPTSAGSDFYSRGATGNNPAVLWVQHPQGKLNETKEFWFAKALELIR